MQACESINYIRLLDFGYLELKLERSNKLRPFCFENRTRYVKDRRPGIVTWFVSWNRISIFGVRKIFSNSVRLEWHWSPHRLLFSGYEERSALQTASRSRMRGATSALHLHYICTTSALHLHYICTTSALYLHYICTTSALHLHYICTISALHLHCICTTSALHLHYICTTSALHLHYICTTSALYLHYICTTSALHLHYICTLLHIFMSCTRVLPIPEKSEQFSFPLARIV